MNPEQDHHHGGDREDLADRLVEQRVELAGVDERDEDEQADRHGGDDPARELALSRQHGHHPAEVHPRADVRDHLVEHLRRVAARLTLNQRQDGDLVHVGVLHPLGGHLECLVERDPELLVGHHARELAGRRLRRLVGDDGHRAREAVTGAKRGGEDVEVLGKLLAELLSLPACLVADVHVERDRDADGDDEEPDRADEHPDERAEHEGRRARRRCSIRRGSWLI